jgi:hypothetical protein
MLLLQLLLRACWMNWHAMLDELACMNRHAGTGMHAQARCCCVYEIMSSRAVAQPPASRFTPILGDNDLAYESR